VWQLAWSIGSSRSRHIIGLLMTSPSANVGIIFIWNTSSSVLTISPYAAGYLNRIERWTTDRSQSTEMSNEQHNNNKSVNTKKRNPNPTEPRRALINSNSHTHVNAPVATFKLLNAYNGMPYAPSSGWRTMWKKTEAVWESTQELSEMAH
jgi:hypothetical protein